MSTSRYVIGIDTGTGGCKVTFMDRSGSVAAESYQPYLSHNEEPRWVEQEPEDWADAAFAGVRDALTRLPEGAGARIDGISFSAPHHTAVLLDGDDAVIRRAILWNDQRSDVESREAMEAHGDLITSLTFNAAAPTWTLPQMMWLRTHRPEEFARTRSVLFMKDYVRWRFTGVKATDWIEAGGTMFFDVRARRWSTELLDLVGWSEELLPDVVSPYAQVGTVTQAAAERSGLSEGTAVFAGAADSATEVFGAGGVREGDVTLKLATAGNVQRVQPDPSPTPRIISYEHPVDGLFYLNSATNFAAASFRWFRETFFGAESDELGLDGAHRLLNEKIAAVSPGAGGLLFFPFLQGERSPYWDARLRGAFLGLTGRHDRDDMARAVMEGVAFSVRDAARVYDAPIPAQVRLIGGGSKSAEWTQIMADVFNAEVLVPASTEASFGTCLVAAVGAGWFESPSAAVDATQTIIAAVEPVAGNVDRYQELFEIYRGAVAPLAEASHKLTDFAEKSVGR